MFLAFVIVTATCWLTVIGTELLDALGFKFKMAKGAQVGQSQRAAMEDLGHKLLFDKRMSIDNTTSCASCCNAEKAWTSGRSGPGHRPH